MMGAGKTAVGKALATRLGVPFLDSDAEIEAAANMTIAEVFQRDGEAFFRDREAEVIARLLSTGPIVLSTGGGAFLAERNRDAISAAGVSLWLRADLDLLWQRVRHKTTRPLLRTADPRKTLGEIYAARQPIYALADLVADAVSAAIDAGRQGEALTAKAVTGEADLRQVVTAVTNAEVSLQTAIAIRDRVIEAHQDIMRMSI